MPIVHNHAIDRWITAGSTHLMHEVIHHPQALRRVIHSRRSRRIRPLPNTLPLRTTPANTTSGLPP
ncbi:hypothetical protein BIFBRE_04576 [Bifidobacterium breve DSM 20213 = JCM 1192]|uniref:Uncharacterized protein n=1 Tax=Bifidobacterium breve DSM 20213 = JCM 1192 TaxID=518634 RepID=D4BR41_BIFBR|nr:hypothetical protein BIFBRE_04576 [Bifidobacterium breve DSM 20213 = JCM 1192]